MLLSLLNSILKLVTISNIEVISISEISSASSIITMSELISEISSASSIITMSEFSVVRFYFTLQDTTGVLPEITIPMSSFQARSRNGNTSFLSVVVPGFDNADDITAMSSGLMVIKQAWEYGGEILQIEPVISSSIDRIDTHEGTSSKSIILTGYPTNTYATKTITLLNPTYRSYVNGVLRYRLAKPEINLHPGDTVIVNDDTFVVDTISFSISPNTQTIEIASA